MVLAAGITVTLHTRTVTGQDALGNDIYTTVDTPVPGCAFDPGGSVEIVQGQDMVTTTPTLYLPAGTVIAATDEVTVNAELFEIDGSPNIYVNPFTGWQPGIVAKLKIVSG